MTLWRTISSLKTLFPSLFRKHTWFALQTNNLSANILQSTRFDTRLTLKKLFKRTICLVFNLVWLRQILQENKIREFWREPWVDQVKTTTWLDKVLNSLKACTSNWLPLLLVLLSKLNSPIEVLLRRKEWAETSIIKLMNNITQKARTNKVQIHEAWAQKKLDLVLTILEQQIQIMCNLEQIWMLYRLCLGRTP